MRSSRRRITTAVTPRRSVSLGASVAAVLVVAVVVGGVLAVLLWWAVGGGPPFDGGADVTGIEGSREPPG